MENFFCGIDISKNSFNVSVIDSSSKVIFNGNFTMNYEGFNSFIDIILEKFKNCIFAMESTSLYHIPLSSFLLNRNFDIYVINATLVKKFADFNSLRKTKSDKLDSKVIANFLFKNYSSLEYYKINSFNELSGFSRIREHLVFEISKIKTMIKQYLYPIFPEADSNFDIFSKTFISVITTYPSAKSISNINLNDFIFPKKVRKSTIQSIVHFAKQSVGIENSAFESFVKNLYEQLFFLEKQLKEIEYSFIQFFKQQNKIDLDILKSVDGIGEVTAASFLAEIEGKHFGSSKKLRAYIGTDPTIKQSGKMFIKGKISKRGNSHLRRTLWIMTTYVIMWNPTFKAYFKKKRAEGFSYRKAQMAVLNKLIRLLFTLLEKKTFFDKNFI